MKTFLKITFALILFSCGHSNPESKNNGQDTFNLENTNIALIYEDNINGIPCSLFQVTNIVKKDRKIGVIFTFDVTYNNPQKGNGYCAFEPGAQGTKHKIDSILISFSNDSTSIDVTNYLNNSEQSMLKEGFEDYIQDQFVPDDYICVCVNEQNVITEYVNRKHLPQPYSHNIDSTEFNLFRNTQEFINWYNEMGVKRHVLSGWKFSGEHYYFWLNESMIPAIINLNKLSIRVTLSNGEKLTYEREIINELQHDV